MRLALVSAALVSLAAPVAAQSLVYRSPNLGGTWVSDPGVLQFNFVHRFYVAPAGGNNKVTNFPTFTFAAGVARGFGVGLHYGSNSQLVLTPDYRPNEIELYARWRPVGIEGQDGLVVALTPAYNGAARSLDGEASADWTAGAVTVSGAARYISKLSGVSGETDVALAAGATFRLNRYVALSGDFTKLLSHDTTAAWSAGLAFVIPGSPHTFSLHASKALMNTIQSGSIGGPEVLYGFEFTVPLHLSRFAPWFRKSASPSRSSANSDGTPEIRITGFKFPETLSVAAGQTVRWINDDAVDHTITFDGGEGTSPPIGQGGVFTHTFARAGTYTYHCTPHPFMKGTIVVR